MSEDAAKVQVFLTQHETDVVHLRDEEGMTWAQIAKKLDRDRSNCQKAYKRVRARIEAKASGNGEAEAEVVGTVGSKQDVIEHVPTTAQALRAEFQDDIQKECDKALEEVKGKIDDKMLSAGAGEIAATALWRMGNDSSLWAKASLKELASVYATMIDKRQLLRGEPTQITKIQDIRKLDEMAALLHEEMGRRGLIVDVTPEKVG